MTDLNYRRVALVFALSFPLHRNLLYGQFYVLLLLLIVAACWSYLHGFRVLAGALIAIAAVCKIFPILFFVFFLQRRDWRALASGATTGLSAVLVSIAVFGLNAHRTWLYEILPWVMRGEAMPPYTPSSASFSGLLHCLFLNEPQWNPHPWHYSPLFYALLLPSLQMLTLAPAILFISRRNQTRNRTLLEWSALLTASLAVSTIPASYNFVLMIFPSCVLAAILLERKRYDWLAALFVAYLGIGAPVPNPPPGLGLSLLFYAPRLPLMLAVLFGIYALLWRDRLDRSSSHDWTRYAWVAAMIACVAYSIPSALHLERNERSEYAYRLPLRMQGYLNGSPQPANAGVHYVAFTLAGYHLITQNEHGLKSDPPAGSLSDDLAFTSGDGSLWVERAASPRSQIVNMQNDSPLVVDNARDPSLSADGRSLAFVHDDHGRGRLLAVHVIPSNYPNQVALTEPQLNIYEASFTSERDYAFSASEGGGPPRIYLTDATHDNSPILPAESRYPALSPDGRWMAYSRLEHGVWNLWLRNEVTGSVHRIAGVPCNQIEPAWEKDSRTLLYATDCGRSLWFTAIARRRVIP